MAFPADAYKVSNFEQRLIAIAEHFDTFLEKYDTENPQIFRDRIAREQYPLFSGLTAKSNIFHPGLGPQAGISDWTSIQVSTVGANGDGGYNACQMNNPQTYGFSVESKEYTGKNAEWRSPVICVRDTMWTDEAKQQVGYIYATGAMITSQAWEVYSREMYMMFASEADNLYVLTAGNPMEGNPKFSYDPFETYTRTTDFGATEKFTVLKIDAGVEISTLNMSYLEHYQMWLAGECQGAALANTSGFPTFGLMLHLHDFDKMIRDDPDLRADLREAHPEKLFANYEQTFRNLRGWGIIHDNRQMRFKYWKIGADGKLWFRRVLPKREGRTITIGKLPEFNPEYLTAEVAVAVVFLNDVFRIRIPPALNSLGGETSFGPAPGYSGDWQWINYASDSNPLREIGYYYMRMAAFPKPLRFSTRAMALAYRRCPQTWPTACITGSTDAATGAIALAEAAEAADFDATNKTLTVTLAALLGGTVGQAVTVTQTGASATTVAGTLVGDASAPTYVIAFTDAEYAKLEIAYLTTAVGKVTLG